MSETTDTTAPELPEGIVRWEDEDGYEHHGSETSLAYLTHLERVAAAERADEAEKAAAEEAQKAAAAEKVSAEKTAAGEAEKAAAEKAAAEEAEKAAAAEKVAAEKAAAPASLTSTGGARGGRIAGPPAS